MSKSVLSNCFIRAIKLWLILPQSKIILYHNKRHNGVSCYVRVRDDYEIKFYRDRSKPKFSKFLFHTKHKIIRKKK